MKVPKPEDYKVRIWKYCILKVDLHCISFFEMASIVPFQNPNT